MSRYHKNVHMIEVVALGLKHLKKDVVFVGGATTSLYVDDPGAPSSMPSDDVDCIIEVAHKTAWAKLESELRKLGFKNPIHEENPPICRWDYCGIAVDIMPTDETILGFSSRWYHEGLAHKEECVLPNGEKIFILSLPHFLATKFEAYQSRGGNDPRMSHDLEDIVLVLDGNLNALKVLNAAPSNLAEHLKSEFKKLIDLGDLFDETLRAYLANANEVKSRARLVLNTIHKFVDASRIK